VNREKGLNQPHHGPQFNFDEDSTPIGMEIFARAAMEYLNHLSRRDLAAPLSARVFGKAAR
jgi:hypothetical protein